MKQKWGVYSMAEKKYKYPKGEIRWVGYHNKAGELLYIMTSKEKDHEFYFLYEAQPDGTFKKLGKSRNPTELEKKFSVAEKMREGGGSDGT